MKKIGYYLLNILAAILFFASFWALDTYGNFSGDELFFHFLVPLGGISLQSFTNLATRVFLPGIAAGILITVLILEFISKKRLLINILLALIIVIFSFNNIHIFTYISNQIKTTTIIEDNYVETKDVNISFPDKKQNLIYIFLESMENTYTDKKNGGIKKTNLIPNLTKLAKENTNFSNTNKLGGALSLNGTAWTAAAMVGQTSGLPLKINTSSNGIIDLYNFFPNTKTLGDILEENGYSNYLILGSDSNYGCRKHYFSQHGNYQIYDLNVAIKNKEMTQDDIVWWGYDDEDLYQKAKKQLLEIAKKDEPFNYTMLTVDTHFEDGYLDENCSNKYKDKYSNVISCADSKINDFINWIKEQEFYENTTIIIVGDHLSMDTDYFDNINNYERTTYNVIINSKKETKNTTNRQFSSLDMFPTTLAALGATIEGDKLALGTNLYSDKQTLIEEKGYDYVFKELNKRSSYYNNNVLSYK